MVRKSYIAVLFAVLLLAAGLGVIAVNMHPQAGCDNCTVNNTTTSTTQAAAKKVLNVTTTPIRTNNTTKPAAAAAAQIKITYFYQDNCEYCAQMAPVIAQLVKEKYNVTQVNLTSDPNGRALVVKYGLTSVPTLIMTNSKTHKDLTLNGVYTHGMIIEDIASIGG